MLTYYLHLEYSISDNGTEFLNKIFQNLLPEKNIRLISVDVGDLNQQGINERYNMAWVIYYTMGFKTINYSFVYPLYFSICLKGSMAFLLSFKTFILQIILSAAHL